MTVTIDSVTDWFRLVNACLALACAAMMVATRSALPTQRPFTFAVVMFLFWQSYTSVEVVVIGGPDTLGARVYGFTVLLSFLLVVLIWEYCRQRHYLRGKK